VYKKLLPKLANKVNEAMMELRQRLASDSQTVTQEPVQITTTPSKTSGIAIPGVKSKCTNVVYQVSRSDTPDLMEYVFLKPEGFGFPEDGNSLSREFQSVLRAQTGFSFECNQQHLQVFSSAPGGRNTSHQDRDTGVGHPRYVAVLMLSDPNEFAAPGDDADGSFYLNTVYDSVDTDGKTVFGEDVSKRRHFRLERGDVMIFDNDMQIHGVEAPTRGRRETLSVRCCKKGTFLRPGDAARHSL
jgi:hypothetical protein